MTLAKTLTLGNAALQRCDQDKKEERLEPLH
jgi:hypothetical protein